LAPAAVEESRITPIMRLFLPWLISFLALLSIAGAQYDYWQRGLQIAALQDRLAQIELKTRIQLPDLEAMLRRAEQARTIAQRAVAIGPSAAARAVAPSASGLNDMRKNPEFMALWRKGQLRSIQQRYGDAFAALKLSPEKIAKFKELTLEQSEAATDARDAARSAGLTAQETGTAVQAAVKEVTDEINGLLGEDGFRRLQGQMEVNDVKSMIRNTLAIDLSGAGVGLSSDQLSALATIFVPRTRSVNPPAQGWQIPDPQTGLAPSDQAMIEQAAQTLSPAQMPILKAYVLEQRQQQQYILKKMAAGAPGG
jgi:hypothetical protein